MTDKSPDAYRTISEVAEDLDLPQHVLRFWETRFSQIRPLKRGGGRRYYRPDDVELLKGIRYLLYSEGYTIKGVQRILKDQGPRAVQMAVQGDGGGEEPADVPSAPQPQAMPIPPSGMRVEPEEEPDDYSAPPPERPQPAPAPHVPEPPPRRAPAVEAIAPLPALPGLFDDPDGGNSQPPAPAPEPRPAAAPAKPATPPNVSFMRGGLHKPVVPAESPPPSNVLVRKPPPAPEAPTPRFAPVFEADPEPAARAPMRAEPTVSRRDGLGPEQRRALQSALYELSECRRSIEKFSASLAR